MSAPEADPYSLRWGTRASVKSGNYRISVLYTLASLRLAPEDAWARLTRPLRSPGGHCTVRRYVAGRCHHLPLPDTALSVPRRGITCSAADVSIADRGDGDSSRLRASRPQFSIDDFFL